MRFQAIILIVILFSFVKADPSVSKEIFARIMADERKQSSVSRNKTPNDYFNEDPNCTNGSQISIGSQIRTAADLLDFLTNQMKTFVNEIPFGAHRFNVRAPSFFTTLQQVNALIVESTEMCLGLKKRYAFTEKMLVAMLDSARKITDYQEEDSYSLRLLCKMLDLNVRVFALYNLHGDPDSKAQGFGDQVLSLRQNLYYYGASFYNLQNIPLDTKIIFEHQFEQAENNIGFLTIFIPQAEFYK